MLELQRVTISRGGRALIDRVDLHLIPGRLTVVLGPNGAGKSTLVKALSGEWHPTTGRVLLDGQDIRHASAGELARSRAVVPQNTQLAFPFTALEVVMLGMTVPGFGIAADDTIARQALADVGLAGFETRRYTQLSGGERQRVHIARALCQLKAARTPVFSPRSDEHRGAFCSTTALILDEPTSNLDPGHQAMVLALLATEAANGRAVLAVLHDLNLAATWADEIVLMAEGRVLAQGRPHEVYADDVLSQAYGCPLRANVIPEQCPVFVLPQRGA